MELIRHCIVDTNTNLVVNTIEYETVKTGTVPGFEEQPNLICVASETGEIGGTYSDGVIVNPMVIPKTLEELLSTYN
jgi:hypothetical protein